MEQFFEREFLALERELSQLKTAAQRSSGMVETTSKTIPLSIPLQISSSGMACDGSVEYKLKAESNSIITVTLDWYYENVAEEWQLYRTSRAVRVSQIGLPNGYIGITVTASGTDYSTDQSDDLSRLERGESVSITANMTILSTNEFTLERVS